MPFWSPSWVQLKLPSNAEHPKNAQLNGLPKVAAQTLNATLTVTRLDVDTTLVEKHCVPSQPKLSLIMSRKTVLREQLKSANSNTDYIMQKQSHQLQDHVAIGK